MFAALLARCTPAPQEAASRWRASPATVLALAVGLLVFGAGEALIVRAELGSSPWTALAQGVGEQTGISVGAATIALSVLVLLTWIPLRQKPGTGTIANAIVVGLALDATLLVVGAPEDLAVRIAFVFGGIALVAVGSALYLGVRLGPGPRDGLMTGLRRLTGRSVRLIRFAIEGSALACGLVLGGTVGVGSLLFALLIGPAVQFSLRLRGTEAGQL